jgi:hypothetical protein
LELLLLLLLLHVSVRSDAVVRLLHESGPTHPRCEICSRALAQGCSTR